MPWPTPSPILTRSRPRSQRCSTTPPGATNWRRPDTGGHSSSPGRPAPRRTSRRTRAPWVLDTHVVSRPPVRVVVVTYSPGDALTEFLVSLRTATTAPYDVV